TLVLGVFALWAWRGYRTSAARAWSVAALAGAIGAVAVAWPLMSGTRDVDGAGPRSVATDPAWQPFTAARVRELTSAGHPVFVDFTAAWCVTCQVNKRLVLNNAGVRQAFAARDVVLVRADWTRRDPAITTALAALGRS